MRLKAETREAADLALFLQEVTRPLTVAQLAEQFGDIAKSTLWAEWRSGAKDVPRGALQQVIQARTPVGHQSELLDRARVLCGRSAAARAGRGALIPEPRRPPDTVRAETAEAKAVQAFEALVLAQQDQMKAERALRNTEKLVWMLVRIIGRLEPRVDGLEARLLDPSGHDDMDEICAERDRVRDQLGRAEVELVRAKTELAEAQHLEMVAQRRAQEFQRRLAEFEQRAEQAQPVSGVPGDTDGARPSRDEYDITLERISDDRAGNAHELGLLRRRLEDDGSVRELDPSSPSIVRGSVVDNADKTLTSGDDRPPQTSGRTRRWRVPSSLGTGRRITLAVITAIAVTYGASLLPPFQDSPEREYTEAMVSLTEKSFALVGALQDERDLTAGPLTQGQRQSDLVKSIRADTDKARRTFLDSSDLPNESDHVGVRAAVVQIIHTLNELNRIRQSAYTTPDYISQTANSYNWLIRSVIGLPEDMAQATSNSDMIRRTRALNAFSTAKEDYSMQRAILAAALANPSGPVLSDSDRYFARTAFQGEKSALQRFTQIYGPKEAAEFTKGLDGDVVEIQRADKFRERAVTNADGIQAGDRSYLDWIDQATVKLNAMNKIQVSLLEGLDGSSAVASDRMRPVPW